MTVANTTFNDLITFTRASTGTYTDNAGVLQSAAIDTPRFDYNPTTLASLGFLVEESRTNSIPNSMAIGTAAGTPGAVPADWSATTTANGLTREIGVLGTENGIEYIDVRYYGTTTATSNSAITTSPTTITVASSGQTWAGSAYIKLVSGSLSNVVVTNRVNGRTAAGSLVESVGTLTVTPTNAALVTQKAISVGTFTNVLVERATHQVVIAYDSGVAVDITLRIGLPQLELGAFATSTIKSTPTFVSRSTTGTYVDSSGVLQTAAINVARYTYNPQNLTQPSYLVIETARQNLVTYSEDLSNAAWSKGLMTVTGGNLAPDGANSAYLVNTATETSATFPANSPVVANSTTYVLSVFVKAGTASHLRFRFGLAAGSVSIWYSIANKTFSDIGAGTAGVLVTSGFSGGWDRVSVSIAYGASDGGTRSIAVSPVNGAGSTVSAGTVYLWGYQLEAGLFTTSYFPTANTALTRATDVFTTATVNRAADVASINTLSPWYNATEGTLYAKYTTFNASQVNGAVALSDGTNNNRMIIRASNTSAQTAFIGVDATATVWSGLVSSALVNTVTNSAFAYKLNDIAWARNGGTVGADSSASIPVVNQLKLGADGPGTFQLNGYLQKIIYYPQRLTNSEIQALTS